MIGNKGLVVLSGGQDSTTCLYWAMQNFTEVHAITFDYRQRHRREIDAARIVAKMAGIASHEVIELGADVMRGKSPLTDPTAKLETYESFDQMDKVIGDRVELTFVPMRNALFLTIAANRAVVRDCRDIVTGVCQQDNANYPDCRREFIDAQDLTINVALGITNMADMMTIHTPLMDLSKADSIRMAMKIPGAYEALAWTHTAYDGVFPPTGKDHASMLRAQGFLEAGVADPLVVRAWHEGLIDLPATPNYADVTLALSYLS